MSFGHHLLILRPALVVHRGSRLKIGHCFMAFYDVLHAKCPSYAVLIEDMS